jgi:hypothetical protein
VSETRIYYSEKLIQSFERALRTAYSLPYVQLSRRPSKATGRFNVVIGSESREFRGTGEEAGQKIVEIRGDDVPRETFWLAFKAQFDLWEQGEHFVEHISISVFQQIATGDLIRMFRAEWDGRPATDSSSGHAQPHWHFAMGADDFRAVLGAEEPLVSGEENALEFAGGMQTDSGLVDFSGFHFAMSPLWYRGVAACHRQIFESGEELGSWFQNLSTYIAQQLGYVSDKAGVRPGVVREFTG